MKKIVLYRNIFFFVILLSAVVGVHGSDIALHDFCFQYCDNDIKGLIYQQCGITEYGRLASTCKDWSSYWNTQFAEKPFAYIPLRSASFNDQAYAEVKIGESDKNNVIVSLELDKDSWIFDKKTNYFFVFAYKITKHIFESFSTRFTPDITLKKMFGILLHGMCNPEKTHRLTFLSKEDFYFYNHTPDNSDDRMYYAVNGDHTRIVLAGWYPYSKYTSGERKTLYCIDAAQNKIFGYTLQESLGLINYKNIAFCGDTIALHGEMRTNKQSVILPYKGIGQEKIPLTMSILPVGICGDNIQHTCSQRYTYDCIHHTMTLPEKCGVNYSSEIKDAIEFGKQLPEKEQEIVAIDNMVTDYKKGKICTEGMKRLVKFLDDPAPEK